MTFLIYGGFEVLAAILLKMKMPALRIEHLSTQSDELLADTALLDPMKRFDSDENSS